MTSDHTIFANSELPVVGVSDFSENPEPYFIALKFRANDAKSAFYIDRDAEVVHAWITQLTDAVAKLKEIKDELES